jgi:hypothetical protein
MSQQTAAALVPSSVVCRAIKAASTFAACKAAATGVISVKIANLTEGVLKAMMLSKLKTRAVGLLLLALLCAAAGAIYQAQAREQPNGKRSKTMTDSSPAQEIRPPKVADQREYVVMSRLMEAGRDRPKELLCLPKVTLDDGQLGPVHILEGPQNLLANAVLDEKIKIGIFFDVRVRRLGGNKVRLVLSFQKNEVDKSSVSEIRVLGHNVQAIQDVQLHKPVKVVFQRDAKGSNQRWVEITVDEQTIPAPAPPADSVPKQKGGKK